jgi:integrase
LAAVHVFYKHVAARDPASFQLCQRVTGIPIKRAPRRAVDYLEREELDALFGAIDRSTPDGRRDYALVTVAYQTGARVEELIALRACAWKRDARRSRPVLRPPPVIRRRFPSGGGTRTSSPNSRRSGAAGTIWCPYEGSRPETWVRRTCPQCGP